MGAVEPNAAPSTQFAAIVEASRQVAGTRSRRSKIATIAALLREIPPDDLDATIGFLTGEPRQGKIGIGWATINEIDVEPSPTPSLTVRDIDEDLNLAAGDDRRPVGCGTASDAARALRSRDRSRDRLPAPAAHR